MAFHRNDCNNWIAEYKTREDTNSSDDTSLDIAQKALGILDTFRYLMERVIPENGNFPEPSMLFHNNLSIYNIMVSEDGELTGVVNWECVSALPLWKACEFPSFLNCPTRYEAPDPTQHNLDGTDLVYWERLMEYEVTKLRFYFLNEMRRMEPRWVEVYEASQPRRDLDNAIQDWDNAILPMDFRTWMEGVTSGDAMIVPLPPQED
jgi:aminoglycoside phosphotransferase (APT) family kinase protein